MAQRTIIIHFRHKNGDGNSEAISYGQAMLLPSYHEAQFHSDPLNRAKDVEKEIQSVFTEVYENGFLFRGLFGAEGLKGKRPFIRDFYVVFYRLLRTVSEEQATTRIKGQNNRAMSTLMSSISIKDYIVVEYDCKDEPAASELTEP